MMNKGEKACEPAEKNFLDDFAAEQEEECVVLPKLAPNCKINLLPLRLLLLRKLGFVINYCRTVNN